MRPPCQRRSAGWRIGAENPTHLCGKPSSARLTCPPCRAAAHLTCVWRNHRQERAAACLPVGRSMAGDQSAEAFAELRLVAATLMRLKAAIRNEAAMPEAQRRLAHWRGESDAPMWQAP